MFTALVLSMQLVAAEPAELPKPQTVKLLPVWAPAAVGGALQTVALAVFIGIEAARPGSSCTREGCGPFTGANFGLEVFVSAVAIHAAVAVATGVLGLINAVRVGEAKKQAAVTFDGVALHF